MKKRYMVKTTTRLIVRDSALCYFPFRNNKNAFEFRSPYIATYTLIRSYRKQCKLYHSKREKRKWINQNIEFNWCDDKESSKKKSAMLRPIANSNTEKIKHNCYLRRRIQIVILQKKHQVKLEFSCCPTERALLHIHPTNNNNDRNRKLGLCTVQCHGSHLCLFASCKTVLKVKLNKSERKDKKNRYIYAVHW